MSKILVTGGAGYIGSHAVKLLLEKKYQVAVVDNLCRGYRQPIAALQKKFGRSSLKFYRADLRNEKEMVKVFTQEKPEAVLHFAALCLVNESVEKPEKYFENNVYGSLNLLKAMILQKTKYLVFSSTCAVYGESKYLPVDEKHPLSPANPYGESKLITEKMISWIGERHGIRQVMLRYFNVSGASSDGTIGDSKKPSQLLIQNAVRGALKIEPFKLVCPKVKTRDGTPVRDYVNVEDLAEAHLKALDYLKRGNQSDIFNLGTGQGSSVLEIIKQVQEITGTKFKINKGKVRKGEYAEVYADIKKAKSKLGWRSKRTIKDSINSLVKWYQKHPNGWDN